MLENEPAELVEAEAIEQALPGGGLKRLFSNSLTMAAANIFTRGFGYLYVVLIAKRLSTRDIGVYAVLLTSVLLLDLVSNLGLDKIVIREIVRGPEARGRGFFWAALPPRIGISSVAAVICWFALRAVYPGMFALHGVGAAFFLAAIVPSVAARNCEAFLTAHERLLGVALSQMMERVVVCAAGIAVFLNRFTFDLFLSIFLVSALARLIVVAYATKPFLKPGSPVTKQAIRPILSEAGQLFSVELMALVYFRADTFMLSKMAGLRDTGVYQIAYKIFDFTISLFTGFLLAVFPRLVRKTGHSDLRWMLPGGAVVLLIPALLIIALRHVILGSFRSEYLEGSVALVWLMLTVPLVYVTSMMANSVIANGGVKLLMRFAVLLVAFNIGLNWVLIPRWSINGSAFATFASELFSACILVALTRRGIRAPLSTAIAPV